jgi:hypothetical protein
MRRRTLALGGIVLSGAALLLFCCAGHGERSASAPPAGSASTPAPGTTDTQGAPTEAPSDAGATAATLVSPDAAVDVAKRPAPSDAGAAPSSTPPDAGPGSQIARAVQGTDPRDLAFLANIERDLKRDPPPEVHALIAARKRGATRDELTLRIRALPDLGVRVLAFRWLDAVAPAADAGAR